MFGVRCSPRIPSLCVAESQLERLYLRQVDRDMPYRAPRKRAVMSWQKHSKKTRCSLQRPFFHHETH